MLVFTQMLETADERLKIEQIFHTYGNLMFHVANKILNNDHDAEDAVQQALFSIYQNLETGTEMICLLLGTFGRFLRLYIQKIYA